jgi:hypothetical protein
LIGNGIEQLCNYPVSSIIFETLSVLAEQTMSQQVVALVFVAKSPKIVNRIRTKKDASKKSATEEQSMEETPQRRMERDASVGNISTRSVTKAKMDPMEDSPRRSDRELSLLARALGEAAAGELPRAERKQMVTFLGLGGWQGAGDEVDRTAGIDDQNNDETIDGGRKETAEEKKSKTNSQAPTGNVSPTCPESDSSTVEGKSKRSGVKILSNPNDEGQQVEVYYDAMNANYDAAKHDTTFVCVFCGLRSHRRGLGDLFGPYWIEGPVGPDAWVHADCAVWAPGVLLAAAGLEGLAEAVHRAARLVCSHCGKGWVSW